MHLDEGSPASGLTSLTFSETYHSNEDHSPLLKQKPRDCFVSEADTYHLNKRDTLKMKATGDDFIRSIQLEMAGDVINECDDDESVRHRDNKLLVQRKFSMMIDDDVRSIPDIILEKNEPD